jgi:hypothetical protein
VRGRSKGPRLYEWALIATASPGRQLLVRRSLVRGQIGTFELAYFACHAPGGATAELVAVAGARWAVEDCFAEAKNETGLDHYQVRTWIAWYRYVTLSMLAHASWPSSPAPAGPSGSRHLRKSAAPLPVKRHPRACGQRFAPPRTYSPPPAMTGSNGKELIPLTVSEARRLFNLHASTTRPVTHHESWSDWRRRHQVGARKWRYQRRLTNQRLPARY